MTIQYLTIAGGNTTALISDVPEELRKTQSLELLSKVEQVGFIEDNADTLTMMGDELCINALLAFAYLHSKDSGTIYSMVGTKKISVAFKKDTDSTAITLKVQYRNDGEIILFNGIGFHCTNGVLPTDKNIYKQLTEEYNTPAFGYIAYKTKNEPIEPQIYVKGTDSLILETACGSGSIAVHLITDSPDIIQPTGQVISVSHIEDVFTIKAKVEIISVS